MKNIFMILILSGSIFTACKKDTVALRSSSNQSAIAVPGTVTGKATTLSGYALQGVKVTVEHTVWAGTYVSATTNQMGKYTINIPAQPAGDWTAKAMYSKTAYGWQYDFDLDGDTTYFKRANGAVRNFVWKLSGQKPGTTSYYGAHVDLYALGTNAQMDKIKIVFTPIDSVLIDGSPAVSFVRQVEDVAGTFMVKDVPIGKYSIKANYTGRKLYLQNRHDGKAPAVKKTVVFGKYGYLADTEYNIEFWVSE